MKLLFVCNANLQRSPTAEDLFKNSKKHEARSCGIDPLAKTRISKEIVKWADIIICMEPWHKDFILTNFLKEVAGKDIRVLDILDVYFRGDPELVKILKKKLKEFL